MEHIAGLEEAPLLRQHIDRTGLIWSNLASCAPLQIIHGDAHRGNVIPASHGPALADFDSPPSDPTQDSQ